MSCQDVEERKERKHVSNTTQTEKPQCPQCNSHEYIIPVIYGKPTRPLLEQWKKNEIELAGFISINGTQPPWTCTQCLILIDAPGASDPE